MGIIQHLGRNSIGSRQINIRMRILNLLLGLCSFASADSSIGGYSYENPYDSYGLDQNSGWHPPQQVQRSSLLANVFRTNARQALTDPMMMVGAGGALLNAVYTTTATAGVSKAVVLTNSRVDASNKRIATVETRSSNTCAKVKSLLSIAAPTVTYSTSAPATTRASGEFTSCASSPTSGSTADCVATDLLDEYTITNGVAGVGGTIAKSSTTGLAAITVLYQSTAASLSTSNTAISIADFNNFRKRVAQAINALDKKIEAILAISAPSC